MDAFHERKRRVLTILASDQVDRSRKGGLDAPILGLVESINVHPAFFTTSSCSGRITLFLEPIDQNFSAKSPNNIQGCAKQKPQKKGGDWLFVSHENVEFNDLLAAINGKYNQSMEGLLVFRFEPFILALECISVLAAQKLVTCALGAGFRESGITSIGKRVIVAIRCSIRLEVPIARMGRLMVSEEYLKFLTELSNKKMYMNRERTSRFLASFTDQFKIGLTCPYAAVLQPNNNGNIADQSVFSDNSQNGCPLTALPKTLEKKLLVLGNRQKRILERLNNLESQLRSPLQISIDEGTPNKGFLVYNDAGLAFSNMILSSGSIEWLHRWGHTTCTISSPVGTIRQSSLLIFGGYGGVGRHARLSDTLLLDQFNGTIKHLDTIEPPSPRMGHRAFVLGDKMWVIGGREDPSTPLQEVMVLDIDTLQWNNVKTTGAKFLPRHRHAGASLGSRIYIHGGLGRSVAYGDLLVLDTHLRHWSLLECRGDIPSPRYSHSLIAIGNKLYMFGGFDGATIFGDIYMFDISTCTWTKETTIGDQPVPRFSHSCTAFGQYMALLGGCPITKQSNELFILDTKCMSWKQYRVQVPSDTVLVRHTVTVFENKLIVVGGGTSCFAFGTSFSNPFLIDVGCHIYEANGEHLLKDRPGIVSPFSQQSTLAVNALEDTKMKTSQKAMVLTSRTDITEEVGAKKNGWVFQLDSILAKIGKDALKTLGWIDRERKVQITCMGAKVAFPITLVAANQIICMKQLLLEKENDVSSLNLEGGTDRSQAKLALERCIINGGEAREVEVSDRRNCAVSPYTIMRERISLLLRDNNLPIHLVEELPARWECLGDMAVLPANSLTSNSWASLGDVLWIILAEILNVSRIARQGTVASTGTRDSTLQILYGNDAWVVHRENGIVYSFDATKCMFSSGNVSERIRVSRMNCVGEIVVDLFAGIGYFTLPFLVRSGAEMVYACEWNPHALLALRHNLHVNAVDARCIVIEGDNRVTAPQGIANRVCLGLLPSSEESWSVAVKALRPDGGMLHVHANVKDTEEKAWAEYLKDKIINYALSQGRSWHVQLTHMERVKWYAPHIRHLVADVHCSYEGTKLM